ncbi:DUF6585 family protein [Nocardia sp. GCM10030253]|uniref:DUF6585 family protein n=1 Tax=Nocardia sp. GCM10030253 TaxID=3273404 RepID=UPI0036391583
MTTPSTVKQGEIGTGVPQKVPPSQLIHLMAEYQKLGTHRQTFLPAPASDTFVRGCGIVAGGFVTVGAICAVVGAYPGAIAVGLLALLPASSALFWGRRNRHNRAARLDLFEFGMTVYRSGEKIAGFRWDSAEVRQQVIPFQNSAPSDYSLAMYGPGGAEAAFDDTLFGDARDWGRAIQSAVTATQLPRAVAAIDDGATVDFGEIALNLEALTFRGKTFAWEHIQLIDARSGLVRMKVDGNWVSLTPVGRIPNFYIFNELAERLRLTAAAELSAAETTSAQPSPEIAAAPAPSEGPEVSETAELERPAAGTEVEPAAAKAEPPASGTPVIEPDEPRTVEATGAVDKPQDKAGPNSSRDSVNPADMSTATK